jgi:hypothetical protein
MEAHEKIKDIQARAEKYKDGDKDLAVTLIRFDLPYLTKLIQDMSLVMDFLRNENHRLKAESNLISRRTVEQSEFFMEDGNGQSENGEEALAQGVEAKAS